MEGLGINWKVLIGDLITFVILLFLLKRFAFKPFFEILRKRKDKIESGLKKSEEAQASLDKIRLQEKEMKEMGEKNAKEIVKEAQVIAEKKRQAILNQAEAEKQKIILAGKKTAEKEIIGKREQQKKETVEMSFLLAEKLLEEKFDQQKDKKFMEKIISGLK
jgi:F-type H+-transporting ATPase subunit b